MVAFATAAATALVSNRPREAPRTVHLRAVSTPPQAPGGPASASLDWQRDASNRAPVVRQARFGRAEVNALGDLRLLVEAHDPDGDSVRLRTGWWVNEDYLETPAPVLTRDRLARGDRVRARVYASDGSKESPGFDVAEIVVGNAPPMITTFPNGFDASGAFVYPIGVIDADGDRDLEYVLVEGPAGMRIEAHEGTLTWRPGPDQVGRHAVRIEVRDGRGGSESQAFTLEVDSAAAPGADLAGS